MRNLKKKEKRDVANHLWPNQGGEISRIILILAGAILLVVVIAFIAVSVSRSRQEEEPVDDLPQVEEPPKPVYELTMRNISFTLESSRDLGGVLYGTLSRYPTVQKDLVTTERFIEIVVGAQNKGTVNTSYYDWTVGNIVDSEGRSFVPLDYRVAPWLPATDLCGVLLKPEFEPVPCVKIYEVSKASAGLKIEVKVTIKDSSRKETAFLDLDIK